MILLKVKLDLGKCKRIVLHCYMLQWSRHYLMSQLKQSWQHCQPCIVWYLKKNSNEMNLRPVYFLLHN